MERACGGGKLLLPFFSFNLTSLHFSDFELNLTIRVTCCVMSCWIQGCNFMQIGAQTLPARASTGEIYHTTIRYNLIFKSNSMAIK